MKFIDDLHHDYDPLYFVLLFPRGEAGWSPYIPLRPKTSKVGEDGDNSSAVMAHEANEDDDEEGDEEEGNQHRYAEDDDHALNNDETEAGTTANAGITTLRLQALRGVRSVLPHCNSTSSFCRSERTTSIPCCVSAASHKNSSWTCLQRLKIVDFRT